MYEPDSENVIRSILFFFFKQKTAYEMRISDWSSDVCSSDLQQAASAKAEQQMAQLLDEAVAKGLAQKTARDRARRIRQSLSHRRLRAPVTAKAGSDRKSVV